MYARYKPIVCAVFLLKVNKMLTVIHNTNANGYKEDNDNDADDMMIG